MRLLTFFTAFLLVETACTAPTSNKHGAIKVINEEFFPESLVVYRSEHDIVSILLPINAINSKKDSKKDLDTITFIVEADKTEKGERVDQGLYMLKGGHATKLLDHGRDTAADIDTSDTTKTAYFAAKDGIYTYNAEEIKAEKYGSVTDSLISIAKVNGNDILYVLTEDHVLYKVTEKGTKKEKIDSVLNAQQIVLDNQNVLYYYTTDNQVYALGSDGVKKIEGLPQLPTDVNIIRPPIILQAGVLVVVNNNSYVIYENGTSELAQYAFSVKPTAYSVESVIIQYYAYNKKIYEYNLIKSVFSSLSKQLSDYLGKKFGRYTTGAPITREQA